MNNEQQMQSGFLMLVVIKFKSKNNKKFRMII